MVVALVPTLAGTPAAAQSDTVTLTVSVRDPADQPVSNATVTASWDGGSVERTTAGNGKAFMDVPVGETVSFTVDHSAYVRNRPYTVTPTGDAAVAIPVSRSAGITIVAVDDEGERVEGATVSVVRKGRSSPRGGRGPTAATRPA